MNIQLKKRLAILKAKNTGKKYKDSYIKELENLVKISVHETRILSLEETLEIPPVKGDKKKYRFLFDNKAKLKSIIESLILKKDGKIFVLTYYSKLCGAFVLDSLKEFNACFDFKAEHQGLIQLRLVDSTSELLLDFYEENDKQLLEVEIIGGDWVKVDF